MSKQTLALIIFLLLLTVFLIAIAARMQQQRQITMAPPITVPTPTPVAQTVLVLFPNPLVVASPSGSLAVTIDTGENPVTAVQLEFSYNPLALPTIDIKPSTFFENPVTLLKTVDTKNGKISYALAIPPTGAAKKGKGEIATISFTTNIPSGQKSDIILLPKSLVTAEGVQKSVLKSSSGATIFYVQSITQPQTTSSAR